MTEPVKCRYCATVRTDDLVFYTCARCKQAICVECSSNQGFKIVCDQQPCIPIRDPWTER